MALDTGCPIVYPLYTLAPLGMAAECIQGGLQLLLCIYNDPRYRDHQIIVTGASAGGWIALRLVLALGEIVLGKATVRSHQSAIASEPAIDPSLTEHLDSTVGLGIARRISEIVLQSPWLDTDLDHPGDRDNAGKVGTQTMQTQELVQSHEF